MLYINPDNSIRLTRGDTAYLDVSINDTLRDSEYDFGDGDTLTMTVRRSPTSEEIVFQKTLRDNLTFHIKPEDTKGWEYGVYVYDIQLTMANDDVYTVIPPTRFTILPEVTW